MDAARTTIANNLVMLHVGGGTPEQTEQYHVCHFVTIIELLDFAIAMCASFYPQDSALARCARRHAPPPPPPLHTYVPTTLQSRILLLARSTVPDSRWQSTSTRRSAA
jgi:hypothetical protein